MLRRGKGRLPFPHTPSLATTIPPSLRSAPTTFLIAEFNPEILNNLREFEDYPNYYRCRSPRETVLQLATERHKESRDTFSANINRVSGDSIMAQKRRRVADIRILVACALIAAIILVLEFQPASDRTSGSPATGPHIRANPPASPSPSASSVSELVR